MMAADIAVQAKKIYPSKTKLLDREEKCWLAAICIRLKEFDSLNEIEMREVFSNYMLNIKMPLGFGSHCHVSGQV